MSIGPRATTEGERALLRSTQQAVRLFALVDTPPAIFKARVNQNFGGKYDQIVQVTYDNVTLGAYTDIENDMTLLIGSAEGLADRGVARIRKAPTSSILYIGETSEIKIQDNDYLTVVAGYEPWAKHILSIKDNLKIDWDIAYSSQHADPTPVPVLGSDVVQELIGDDIDIQFDAGNSWVIGGASLSYQWACVGAVSITDDDTATPTINFDTPGRYLVYCEVSTATQSMTGVRVVHILGTGYDPTIDFSMGSVDGDLESGGWSTNLTVYGDLSGVRDRAKVIIFGKDYLDLAENEQGPDIDRENIWLVGWIIGETIHTGVIDNQQYANFEIATEHHILSKEYSLPVAHEDTRFGDNGGGAANRWDEFANLTVPKALWNFINYRTTLTRMTDVVIPTGETDKAAQLPAPAGSLWSQIGAISDGTILARAACDRLGRLWISIDPQCTPEADRSSIPVVMELTADDVEQMPVLRRTVLGNVGRMEMAGDYYNAGVITKLGAVAPGNTPGRYGDQDPVDGVVVASQADIIQKCGLLYGYRNNPYSEIPLTIMQINRFIDIWPPQYCELPVDSDSNQRGLNLGTINIIPRQLSISYDPETGKLAAEGNFEAESFQATAVALYFPGSDGGEDPGGGGDEPPEPPPPDEDDGGSDTDVVCATSSEVRTTDTFDEATPEWDDKTGAISGTIIDFVKVDDDTALALTASNLYKTSDLGESSPTWEEIYDNVDDWPDDREGGSPELLRVAETGGRIYILGYSDQGDSAALGCLMRSNNGGDTWATFDVEEIPDAFEDYLIVPYWLPIPTGTDKFTWGTISRDGQDGDTNNPWAVVCDVSDAYDNGSSDRIKLCFGGYDGGAGPSGDEVLQEAFPSPVGWGTYDYVYITNTAISESDELGLKTMLAALYPNYDDFEATIPNQDVRTQFGVKSQISSNNAGYIQRYWVVWKKRNLNVPKALAASGSTVYIGLADKILVSENGGESWINYVEDHGANDIVIPAYDNPDAKNILYWSTDGYLYWAHGVPDVPPGDYGSPLLGETAQDVHYRICPDHDNGFPIFALACIASHGWSLYMLESGGTSITQSLLVLGIDGARSLKAYKNEDLYRVFYLSTSNIHYSDDSGETWSDDRVGDWSDYGGPVRIEALSP